MERSLGGIQEVLPVLVSTEVLVLLSDRLAVASTFMEGGDKIGTVFDIQVLFKFKTSHEFRLDDRFDKGILLGQYIERLKVDDVESAIL